MGVSVRVWRAAAAETRSCAHLIVPDVVLVEEELPNDGELVDDDQHEQEGEEERLRVDRDRLDDLDEDVWASHAEYRPFGMGGWRPTSLCAALGRGA